jgi:gliding motility-associated-like protein
MLRLLAFTCFAVVPCYGQQYLSNPSFEGPLAMGVPPPGWKSCLDWSTPDTQPGTWEITLPPSNGNSYVSIVTRGLGGYANDGFSEAIGTQLLIPLQPQGCYLLSIDVAYFPGTKWYGSFGELITYDTPSILNVWSSTDNCVKKELLFSSKPISNTEWQTLTFPITSAEIITNFMFQADYNQGNIRYGNILVDNIRIESFGVDLGSDATLCDGQTRTLSVDVPNSKVLWNNGATTNSILTEETGKYSVIVETKGCVLSDTVNLVFLRKMEKFLPGDTTLCPGDDLLLHAATPAGTAVWNNGATTSQLLATSAGRYSVIVNNGCEIKSESIEVSVDKNYCCNLSAPNVFPPNGDNLNDVFEISSPSNLDRFSLTIYNRWGKVVFRANELNNNWKGETENKEETAPGVYYWTASITCSGKKQSFGNEYRGTVTLLR